MAYGLQLFNSSGVLTWDSSTVVGGVLADVRTYAASGTATLLYPAFAGNYVRIIHLLVWNEAGTAGVVADTALGYPRVTVSAASTTRKFALEVY